MRLIDSDALVKDGYVLHRTYRQDGETMVYETKRIEDIPTAQIELNWIPCNERMPENGEHVLITYRVWLSYLGEYAHIVAIGWHANKYSVREDSFSEWEDDCDYDEDEDVFYIREGWYEFTTQGNCDHASWGICDAEVIAWMPLPEPYGGEQDGSD